jgi:hypothetical protein
MKGYGEVMSPILRRTGNGQLGFWCPGCNDAHYIRVEGDRTPRWGFNSSYDAPTFTPSILVTTPGDDDPEWDIAPTCCHSFVTDGQIQFLGDCTHALAGQTVPIPPFDRKDES